MPTTYSLAEESLLGLGLLVPELVVRGRRLGGGRRKEEGKERRGAGGRSHENITKRTGKLELRAAEMEHTSYNEVIDREVDYKSLKGGF